MYPKKARTLETNDKAAKVFQVLEGTVKPLKRSRLELISFPINQALRRLTIEKHY